MIVHARSIKRLTKRCRRCGKRWCGTDLKLIALYGPQYADGDHGPARVTFGSIKCRDEGPKR